MISISSSPLAALSRVAIGARSSRRAVSCTAAAASAASPGPGTVLYTGPGKSGTVLFTSAPAPTAAKTSPSTAPTAPCPGPGLITYTGAGKMGVVSFSAAPASLSVRDRLAAAGLAGIVAYGLLNTLYYTAAFLMCWFTVAKVPAGQGAAAAATAVAKTLAIVWAGSQVTKVPRAGAALLAVPAVDALLAFVRDKLRLGSKRDAFLKVIFPACIGVAVVLFGGTTLLWI